jgi:hypothetical protein
VLAFRLSIAKDATQVAMVAKIEQDAINHHG